MPVEALQGKCNVRKNNDLQSSNVPVIVDNVFLCNYSYNPNTGAIKQV